ncbi:MAG: hypothetical protein B7Y25_01260 [Alphaproteobacteria bacterium 16-39-46]|nr:MAG: hypothetical protein B7Y25_01260 [Alphaproteobacteria bacterium 16-39-46]OZA44130.1 MAG: hypothetical protein B7X84_01220 [Alphaproteobacteria bacterium 17-39-52]HQS83525.1 hypothetical protein [Alphaproteobacteria bacterium]HQS93293.1 hypothetical protein [Alphaproteobacteria bacterium]
MKKNDLQILTAVLTPTRILGMIPSLFIVSIAAPFLGGVLAHSFNHPPLFWALIFLVLSSGASLYITFIDEDFLRIKKARHYFKKTRNHIPSDHQKYTA